MTYDNNKISIRQTFVMLILLNLAPAEKILPGIAARLAGHAVWLAPLVSFAIYAPLVLMFSAMFAKHPEKGLHEIYTKVAGKFIGRLLSAAYGIWAFVIIATFLRINAERFIASIFPNTPPAFFIIAVLTLVLIAANGKLEALARFSELSLYIFIGMFVFLFFICLPNVSIKNLLPVTVYDAVPVLRGGAYAGVSWFYITFMLFFGENISDKEHIKKFGIRYGGVLAFFSLVMILITVGQFGANLIKTTSLPFFMAIKSIRIFDAVERLESIFITLWTVVDFIMTAVFAFVLITILGKLTPVKNEKVYILPVIIICFFLALFLYGNIFELTYLWETFGSLVNLALGAGVPLIIFVIGKLRRIF